MMTPCSRTVCRTALPDHAAEHDAIVLPISPENERLRPGVCETPATIERDCTDVVLPHAKPDHVLSARLPLVEPALHDPPPHAPPMNPAHRRQSRHSHSIPSHS